MLNSSVISFPMPGSWFSSNLTPSHSQRNIRPTIRLPKVFHVFHAAEPAISLTMSLTRATVSRTRRLLLTERCAYTSWSSSAVHGLDFRHHHKDVSELTLKAIKFVRCSQHFCSRALSWLVLSDLIWSPKWSPNRRRCRWHVVSIPPSIKTR